MPKEKGETAIARVETGAAALPAFEPGTVTSGASGLGYLHVSTEAAGILQQAVTDDEIDVLPTGEVYLSQIAYRRRLNAAFLPGGWTLRPVGAAMQMPGGAAPSLVQRFELWAHGEYVGETFGEAEYHDDNKRQTWATAWESAKSNALMRCCKDLGIASECWDRRWAEAWRTRKAIQVWRKGQSRPQWRRLDVAAWYDETGPVAGDPNAAQWHGPQEGQQAAAVDERPVEGARPQAGAGAAAAEEGKPERKGRPITKPQQNRLFAILRARAKTLGVDAHDLRDVVREYLELTYQITSAEQLLDTQYDDVIKWIERYEATMRTTTQAEQAREPGQEG